MPDLPGLRGGFGETSHVSTLLQIDMEPEKKKKKQKLLEESPLGDLLF